ncbi:uncharacterized protein K02A2.6-like [Musca domestica]|uniref:RNA-directed DNA polymerase n=1 Tax=Musca domestica TaxID=7370 RepID=A0ABM3UV12_MUSDO|nr:uncharacterized protein K02A2.6-like [Musca domestica]
MSSVAISPFLCDAIDKALLRTEWEKWYRSFSIYLDAEEIKDTAKKRNKLLYLGGTQLQEVVYNIPGALVESDDTTGGVDVFKILVEKLNVYFSPERNSTFERHLFRSLKPEGGECLNKFLVRLRNQAAKCHFGETKHEILGINIKDKLIDNWAPNDLKKRLLEKEYTLTETIEMCHAHEQINNQTETMKLGNVSIDINKIESKNQQIECGRCGRQGHEGTSIDCPAKNSKCNKCGLIGHFARKCKSKGLKRKQPRFGYTDAKKRKYSNIQFVSSDGVKEVGSMENKWKEHNCFQIAEKFNGHMDEMIECYIGGRKIHMLIDSGSHHNLLSEVDWECLVNGNATVWNIRTKSENQFRAYAGNNLLKVKAVFEAVIGLDPVSNLISSFYVIENGRQSLLGRVTAIKLGVLKLGRGVNQIENCHVFPKIRGIKVSLTIDKSVKPVQQPLRRVPSGLEEKVERKLNEALQQDIIEPVTGPSPWISPIVIVFKGDGDIRLCIDMRRANMAILRENYPLPTFDSFMTKLQGAEYFSRLDLKNAYHQLELEEESREITTFITSKGLFRYKRLLFGVNSAPEIFQRIMESILAPCNCAINYLDDIIVFGKTEAEHDGNLKEVLAILEKANVMLNKDKCIWKARRLLFLGHILSDKGINPDPEKIDTIMNFRPPTNKEELRSFLGLVTYLGKFIPDLADLTDKLRNLMKKDVKFDWGHREDEAFLKLKQQLARTPTLSYFDPERRTRLIADASPVALGAVLLQFCNNMPQVISFASKSLSETERRYSQTEKESLALVWSVERFYYYLAGIEFELVTDHKPLETIFKPTSKPPARIERWVLRLQSFRFKIIYQAGKYNIADSLSRLCKIEHNTSFDQQTEISICSIIEETVPRAVSILEIVEKNQLDLELMEAVESIKNNSWTSATSNRYFPFRLELCTLGNILLRGTKIVIPGPLRTRVLALAHEGHPGETVMKRRVRSKVWWPLIDRDVEKHVKNCHECLLVSRPPHPAPMTRRVLPEGPWLCLAMDLLGPLPNNDFIFVVIDYYSRYQEVKFLKKITSNEIINFLDELFSRLGYPKSVTTDNGRQFVSDEFRSYCANKNIEIVTSPPYWPQANGEVENMNRSIVKRLRIAHSNGTDYKKEIQKFLLMYNVTPHGTTGKAPTELLFNRVIRDKIPSISDVGENILDAEARDLDAINKEKGREKADKVRGAKQNNIQVGDKVLVQNVIFPNKLTPTFGKEPCEVVERKGNDVTIRKDGKLYRRNVSHLKKLPITPEPGDNNLFADRVETQIGQDQVNPRLTLKLKNIGGMWRSGNTDIE